MLALKCQCLYASEVFIDFQRTQPNLNCDSAILAESSRNCRCNLITVVASHHEATVNSLAAEARWDTDLGDQQNSPIAKARNATISGVPERIEEGTAGTTYKVPLDAKLQEGSHSLNFVVRLPECNCIMSGCTIMFTHICAQTVCTDITHVISIDNKKMRTDNVTTSFDSLSVIDNNNINISNESINTNTSVIEPVTTINNNIATNTSTNITLIKNSIIKNKRRRYTNRNNIRRYLLEQKIKSSTKIPYAMTKLGHNNFTNESSHTFTKEQGILLSQTLNFIPVPLSNNSSIMTDFEKYARSIRLKYQWFNTNRNEKAINLTSICRTPNPNFVPDNTNKSIETYLKLAHYKLRKLIDKSQSIPTFFTDRHNVIKRIINSIKELNTIIITQADKNLGPVVVDRLWYEQEALRQLRDTKTYTEIEKPALPITSDAIKQLLILLDPHMSLPEHKTIYKYISQKFPVGDDLNKPIPCACFYLLVKIHKPPPYKGRPIAASIPTLTYHASKFISNILKPFMRYCRNTVKNSYDVILKLTNVNIPKDAIILTGDVASLYPSIVIPDCLSAVHHFLLRNIDTHMKEFPKVLNREMIPLVLTLLSWVLNNNYLNFGNTYWHQITGIAMGTPCAVVISDIYLHMLEQKIFHELAHLPIPYVFNTHIIVFFRYIDDLFIITDNISTAERLQKELNEIRKGQIVIEFNTSLSFGIFLDLTIFKRHVDFNNRLDTKTYQKPINKYLYLPPTSFHPPHVYKGYITSELKRYRIQCSLDNDYDNMKRLLHKRLLNRSFKPEFLKPIFDLQYNRDTLLQGYANRNTTHTFKDLLIFTSNYSPLYKILMHRIKETLTLPQTITDIHKTDPHDYQVRPVFTQTQLIVSSRNAPSLRHFLMRSRYPFDITPTPTSSSDS